MSACEVDFADASDDADPVAFHNSAVVTAKKAHTCSECDGGIAIGERYRRTAYKFEGAFSMDRVCACCLEAATEFNYYIMGGSLWLMFHEAWDNGSPLQACLNRLETAKAKEHMRSQWMKWRAKRDEYLARRRASQH
jgi:hypothetical protein